MAERLTSGDNAPAFTLQDSTGSNVSLTDFRGRNVVVYFYPAASTPGCTKEACDFRDNIASLQGAGYDVVGISPDPLPKLVKFAEKEELNFPLLSDEDHSVAESYGAWGEKKNYGKTYWGVHRSTFVIAPDGTVEKALYGVKADGHVDLGRQREQHRPGAEQQRIVDEERPTAIGLALRHLSGDRGELVHTNAVVIDVRPQADE